MKLFNSQNTLLVLTSFPTTALDQTPDRSFNAVGWHSVRTLTNLSKKHPIVVFAEVLNKKRNLQYTKEISLKRIWEKGNIFSFIPLFQQLKNHKSNTILVQFEFNIFGGIIPNLAIIAMLGLLRLLGKSVTFELHQVILDIAKLEKHVAIKNPLKQQFFNLSLRLFYLALGIASTTIIVFEQDLKDRLSLYVSSKKIQVLSLAVEQKKKPTKQEARKALGLPQKEFIVMLFGFINGYKGFDWTIDTMKKIRMQNTRLLLVGGENPYLQDKPFYQKFYQGILNRMKGVSWITHTGFVDEEKIATYFAASDVLVLPYEVFMSASGPFSHALSYAIPTLLSSNLEKYAHSLDFKQAMEHNDLKKNDVFFALNQRSFRTLLTKLHDKKQREKLEGFMKELAEKRSMRQITHQYDEVLFAKQIAGKTALALS